MGQIIHLSVASTAYPDSASALDPPEAALRPASAAGLPASMSGTTRSLIFARRWTPPAFTMQPFRSIS
jgi:hypothetical protein